MKDIGILLLFATLAVLIAMTGAGTGSMLIRIGSILIATALGVIALIAGVHHFAGNKEKVN